MHHQAQVTRLQHLLVLAVSWGISLVPGCKRQFYCPTIRKLRARNVFLWVSSRPVGLSICPYILLYVNVRGIPTFSGPDSCQHLPHRRVSYHTRLALHVENAKSDQHLSSWYTPKLFQHCNRQCGSSPILSWAASLLRTIDSFRRTCLHPHFHVPLSLRNFSLPSLNKRATSQCLNPPEPRTAKKHHNEACRVHPVLVSYYLYCTPL